MKRNFFEVIYRARSITSVVTALASVPPLVNGAEATSTQTNAPPPTVESVVADILAHNPELNFYKAEIAAAKAERRTAATWANPEFSSGVGGKRVRDSGLSGEGIAWSVSVQQTFEWPGRIPLRKAVANRQITLAELGFEQFKAALAARARSLVLNLFAEQEKAAAAREVAARLQDLREVLVQRDPAGVTPALETRVIEATELTLQRRASEAALAEQTALLELNQLRGQAWTEKLKVSRPALAFPPAPEVARLIALALTNNFEIQIRRAELEQQGFKVALARNERYPSFSIGPYVSEEHAADRERQLGIGVTLPLPIWNQNTGKIAAEEARQKQAATLMLVTQRQIERQIAQKHAIYEAKLAEMAKWRPDSIEKFQEAAALADRHYRLGAVPIATYVELQKQYLEAVSALLETRREALEAAQDLQRLTGLEFNQNATNPKGEKK